MSGIEENKEMLPEEEESVIVLMDDEGNELEFEFLDLVEYKEESYVLLIPHDEESDGGVVILKTELDENGEPSAFSGIDDDELLDAIFETFKEKNGDLFDFED